MFCLYKLYKKNEEQVTEQGVETFSMHPFRVAPYISTIIAIARLPEETKIGSFDNYLNEMSSSEKVYRHKSNNLDNE